MCSGIRKNNADATQFANITQTRQTITPQPSCLVGTHAAKTTSAYPIGPWKSFKITQGDKVTMSAKGLFLSNSTSNNSHNISLFVNAWANNPSTNSPDQNAGNSPILLNVGLGIVPTTTNTLTTPRAYLRYIFYDENDVPLLTGSDYIHTASGSCDNLSLSFTATTNGTIQVYVANESNVEVWFDEVSITHEEHLIVQENHYYPFGMNLVGIEKEGEPNHRFQFQGQEKQEEFGLNWSSFKWRNADVQLGRFFSVDPLASDYVYNSVYAFSENKVTNHVELEGLEAVPAEIRAFGNWIENKVKSFTSYVNSTVDYFTSNTKITGSVTAKVTQGSYGVEGIIAGAKGGFKTTASPQDPETNLIGWHEGNFELVGKNSEGVDTRRHNMSGGAFFGGKIELEAQSKTDELKSLKASSEVNLGLLNLVVEKELNSGETNLKINVAFGGSIAAFFGIAFEIKGGLEFNIQKGEK